MQHFDFLQCKKVGQICSIKKEIWCVELDTLITVYSSFPEKKWYKHYWLKLIITDQVEHNQYFETICLV